jgi:acyl dehydratase
MVIVQQHQHVSELVGLSLGASTVAYDERDAILYALAVGAHADERRLVDEQQLRVLSTYGLALGLWAVEAAGATGAYDPVRTLHVGQRLQTRDALPPAAAIEMQATVAAVWDKQAAALVEIEVESPFFTATYGIWVPGAGGFDGPRGPSAARADGPAPEPDVRESVQTQADQAALYRLTGDLHPLHIDPQVARDAGFDRPILHGLCVLGATVLTLARAVDADAADVRELSVRFAAPVYPGAAIDVAACTGERGAPIGFTASVEGDDVLKSGSVAFGTAGR